MTTETLLYIAFIMYIGIMFLGFIFRTKWLFMIAGLLWFIPILEIPNTFIVLISSIMIIFHGILGFYERGEGFE